MLNRLKITHQMSVRRFVDNDPQIIAQHYFDAIECLNGKVCFVNCS